jgi:hypothetical protein
MSRFEEVWVITRANNRGPIEQVVAREPLPNAHFVYFDLPPWMRFWKRGQFGVLLYYYLWQAGVYFIARKFHREVGFDLIHHVTFAKYWAPSFLVLLPAPLLWGPIGGGDSHRVPFGCLQRFRGMLNEQRYAPLRAASSAGIPFVRLTARRSALVLANTQGSRIKVFLGAKMFIFFTYGDGNTPRSANAEIV